MTGEVLVTFGDVAGSAAAAPPPTPLVPELEPPVAAELPPAAPPVEPRSVPPGRAAALRPRLKGGRR